MTIIRFASWGRVSTEDRQDPESSRNWQRARASGLIEPHGGQIVTEFFDIDKSRSIPPQRRPEAARLLTALADPHRGFDAVVVGEPQRAFYGNQFGNTFPLFAHYGVPLWVPEVGGPIDPDNEAHDLIMSVFGGVSKGERNRIKIRVRTAMATQAQVEGRYLGGRPPYGYRLTDAGPHPNPAKAADGKRLHALTPNPETADVVRRIFSLYLAGHGLKAIAERLTADGIPSPSAHDPARNRHRSGIAWAWGAVAVILANPRYTGRQVWNRQPKEEVLLDVEDVALGFTTRQRWNNQDQWIWSDRQVHEPLVDTATFEQAQALRRTRTTCQERAPRPTPRPYLLRGLLFCGVCGRRMQGSWNNDAPYYRCMFLSQYAARTKLAHPRAVYLREDHVVPGLDQWLGGKFSPATLRQTIRELTDAAAHSEADLLVAQARREIADCESKLRLHRAALEAGADPAIVTAWIADVQAQRTIAEARLNQAPTRPRLTPAEVERVIAALGDIVAVLATADPAKKAETYAQLGLKLTYRPEENTVTAEARPAQNPDMYIRKCPRGESNPHAHACADGGAITAVSTSLWGLRTQGCTGSRTTSPPSRFSRRIGRLSSH
jgi:site-specific DNA recombinase